MPKKPNPRKPIWKGNKEGNKDDKNTKDKNEDNKKEKEKKKEDTMNKEIKKERIEEEKEKNNIARTEESGPQGEAENGKKTEHRSSPTGTIPKGTATATAGGEESGPQGEAADNGKKTEHRSSPTGAIPKGTATTTVGETDTPLNKAKSPSGLSEDVEGLRVDEEGEEATGEKNKEQEQETSTWAERIKKAGKEKAERVRLQKETLRMEEEEMEEISENTNLIATPQGGADSKGNCADVEKGEEKTDREKETQEAEEEKRKRRLSAALPKMTFYDEMIDLLKEKLEDPDNYATVADSQGAANQELYQDPEAMQKHNSKSDA